MSFNSSKIHQRMEDSKIPEQRAGAGTPLKRGLLTDCVDETSNHCDHRRCKEVLACFFGLDLGVCYGSFSLPFLCLYAALSSLLGVLRGVRFQGPLCLVACFFLLWCLTLVLLGFIALVVAELSCGTLWLATFLA